MVSLDGQLHSTCEVHTSICSKHFSLSYYTSTYVALQLHILHTPSLCKLKYEVNWDIGPFCNLHLHTVSQVILAYDMSFHTDGER